MELGRRKNGSEESWSALNLLNPPACKAPLASWIKCPPVGEHPLVLTTLAVAFQSFDRNWFWLNYVWKSDYWPGHWWMGWPRHSPSQAQWFSSLMLHRKEWSRELFPALLSKSVKSVWRQHTHLSTLHGPSHHALERAENLKEVKGC